MKTKIIWGIVLLAGAVLLARCAYVVLTAPEDEDRTVVENEYR